MRKLCRLQASFVFQNLDDCIVAGCEKPGPVGRDLTPDLLAGALAHKRTFGAIPLDQMLCFKHVERFANGGACDAEFGG